MKVFKVYIKVKTPLLILTLLFLSCSKLDNNKYLIGSWKSIGSANILKVDFFKDTLVVNTWGSETKFSWKNDYSKIYYSQLTNINPELEVDFEMLYELSSSKDTLSLKIVKDTVLNTNQFIKIE